MLVSADDAWIGLVLSNIPVLVTSGARRKNQSIHQTWGWERSMASQRSALPCHDRAKVQG